MVKQQLSAAAQQTKIRHTSPDKIKDCTVWLPSLEKQKQIGQLLFDLDRKIEINRAINHNLVENARHRLLPVHSLGKVGVHRAAL